MGKVQEYTVRVVRADHNLMTTYIMATSKSDAKFIARQRHPFAKDIYVVGVSDA